MKQPTKLLTLSCALVLGFAATSCGSDSDSSSSTAAAAASTTIAAPSSGSTATSEGTASSGATGSTDATEMEGSSVQLVDSDLGEILADSEGRTLYLFTKDSGTTSACTGDCATKWPPLHGPAEPGEGLDEEDFATITGSDGQPQTTFYGHPLYYFSGDSAPGDINGQGVGGFWWVLDKDGNPIKADSAATTTAGY